MSKKVYFAIFLASFRFIEPESLGIFSLTVSTFIDRNLKSFYIAFCFCYNCINPYSFLSLLLMIIKFLIILSQKRVTLIKVPERTSCYSSTVQLIIDGYKFYKTEDKLNLLIVIMIFVSCLVFAFFYYSEEQILPQKELA